tara:strand:- start:375 stop:629 length:255 start_codon:yes stop_codon:yes gene_type:complete
MLKEKKRKEVTLDLETLDLLAKQAELEGRKLKNYMEHVLKQKAEDFELSEAHIEILSKRIEAADKDLSRLTPIEDFYKRVERAL